MKHSTPNRPRLLKHGFYLLTLLSTLAILPVGVMGQQYSELWGKNGELWDPENSRLQNFTNVGYMNGDVQIPFWPVGVNVLDYGAVPDDGKDDSEAFMQAIAACPDKHAVLVPKGRYRIVQQIRIDKDYFVLRGEDMYETVLWFPKNLAELYANKKYESSYGRAFFYVNGGTHRSIENISFEFREQMKMGHWEFRGQDAIYYGGGVEDSWIRNIYLKNVDHGISMGGAKRISVLNIIFDHFIGRPDVIGSSGNSGWVGHVGIGMGKANHCLFHNIEFKGRYFHDFDIINVPNGSVVSNVRGPESGGGTFALHHHGQGARNNLYTNVRGGPIAGLKDSQRQESETHWNFDAAGGLDPKTVPYSTKNNHVFVGYNADLETKITDTLWFESIDPEELHPQNIYLAQMERVGKPLPFGPPPQPPVSVSGDTIRLIPSEGAHTGGFGVFLQFDLSDFNLDSIARARLEMTAVRVVKGPVTLGVSAVEDDTWSADTITKQTRPAVGAILDEVPINEDGSDIRVEFDITAYAQAQLEADKIISVGTEKLKGSGYNGYFRGLDGGDLPVLTIEQVPSAEPGPPSAPTGGRTVSKPGYIVLDWNDSPEADVVTYNVYRNIDKPAQSRFGMPIATGLDTSNFVDVSIKENRAIHEIPSNVTCYYVVTAVDEHGYESPYSEEFSGTALDR